MIGKFNKLGVNDYQLSKVQDNIEQALSGLELVPFINGVVIKDVSLTTGSDQQVAHGLGRNWQYWMVLGNSANSVIYEGTQQLFRDKLITLRCSANSTVSLWVG